TPVETSAPTTQAPNAPNGGTIDKYKQPESSPAPNTENEASAFRSAYKVYLNGNYDRATVEFQRFVKHYPDTTLTPQAFYYLGESLYLQKQYDPAKQTLEHVVTSYPNNKYRVSALYKLGQLMLETDQRPKAQELWNRVIQEFPESPEATQAKEQLKKSGLS
ncbi:MAG: tol-pal system protein YbgF, partial [Nitrospira sp.]|nr:tol-pal system protein YbgF [Nitrospira sp.]